MKNKYQKLIATKGEAKAIVFASKPKAKILVKKDAKKLTKRQNKNTMKPNCKSTLTQNAPFFCAFTKFGKKLCPKAPSAKILLKKAGILSATKKISL